MGDANIINNSKDAASATVADDNTATIKDKVRQVLRDEKIKLWNSPFVNDQGDSIEKALIDLIGQWKNDPLLGSSQAADEVLEALKEWQSHALSKLKEKQSSPKARLTTNAASQEAAANLEIKILGLPKDMVLDIADHKCSFAASAHIGTNKAQAATLRLDGVVLRDTTDLQLFGFLWDLFKTTDLRVIHRGKNLMGPIDDRDGTTLSKLLQTANNLTVPLLCMVATAKQRTKDEPSHSIQSRIAAIRHAARQIHDTTQLEITDQHGVTVPMSADDRLGFLTALALHRMGVQSNVSLEDSLTLLLEADAEWKNHPRLQVWKDRVDNYGLLMLDIGWVYLQLESLDNLPDSIQRLQEAERVLRKQVHVNFVTLALAHADMGNYKEVPPLAAVFAKLFLLQGIAYLYDSRQNAGSASKSQECLDQAFSLLQCLRMLAPADSVQQLLEVSQRDGITPSDAIAALRKHQGNMDAAAIFLSEAEDNRLQRQRDREAQRRHGICQNETDPVDLGAIDNLRALLASTNSTDDRGDGDTISELAVGLLRLCNNDLTRALDLYAECDYSPDAVFAKVGVLDEQLVEKGLLDQTVWRIKKRKLNRMRERPVDEMALATLISMGVDDAQAQLALQRNANNIEQALLWLSTAAGTTGDAGSSIDHWPSNGKQQSVAVLASSLPSDSNSGHEGGGNILRGDVLPHVELRSMQQRPLELAAQELLRRELGNILEDRNLENEYLGKSLDEEWHLILKYRGGPTK